MPIELLPETPSQTAGPYVHIGLALEAAGNPTRDQEIWNRLATAEAPWPAPGKPRLAGDRVFWGPGVLDIPSNPTLAIRSFASGLSMIERSSVLRRLTISGGVLAGANRAAHESMSKSVTPASCRVGTSGTSALRLIRVTASARNVPALTCGNVFGSFII